MRKISFLLFALGIVLLMLHSMRIWFLEGIFIAYVDYATFLLGVLYFIVTKNRIEISRKVLTVYLLFVLATAWNSLYGLSYFFKAIHPTFFLLLLLDSVECKKILSIWTNAFACILAVSLFVWLYSWTGNLPSYGVINFDDELNYTYTNYILCLRNLTDLFRCGFVFLEPGHVGMICAFTLAANRFDLKSKSLRIILICLLFTLSLAGYVLVVLGFILMRILLVYSFKRIVKTSIVFFISFLILLSAIVNYNNGKNYVNELIVERFDFKEDEGIFGNKRTADITDRFFEQFLTSSDLLTGLEKEEWDRNLENHTIRGSGYKMYLMQFGLFGTLFMFLAYLNIYRYSIDKKFMLCLSILYIAAFIQRSYPFWESWLFLYYLPSMCLLQTEKV